MPTRTYLTTPPGRTPSQATGRSAVAAERYVPGLAAPDEPRPPRRWTVVVAVAFAALVVLAAVVTALGVTAGTGSQDPTLGSATRA